MADIAQPQLFELDPIDVPEPWQLELLQNHGSLVALLAGRAADEAHEVLQQRAAENMQAHALVVDGLVYGILTQGSDNEAFFRYLGVVARDGFAHAVGRLLAVGASPRFMRIRDAVRGRVFWLAAALTRAAARGVDQVAMALLRQIRGGDVSPRNIRVATQMVDFLEAHEEWVAAHPVLVGACAYALGRLALEHARVPRLRDREASLVARLVRARFGECAVVGRDLVRMLQDGARLEPLRELWRDLMRRAFPASVDQLLRTPTPRVFLAARLTFDMETRLRFILDAVPAAGYGRNLAWFVRRYLAAPEADPLVCDLVRYIVAAIHPHNAVLASGVVPRYVFLGGLLRSVRAPVAAANAKLALFYDWLFYDPSTDSVMNIEPGVLIIARSVDRYFYMTALFVEFLAFLVDAFSPPLTAAIHKAVAAAMQDAVEKGVVPSLNPLVEHPNTDDATRRYLHQLFPQLVPPPKQPSPAFSASDAEEIDAIPPLDLDAAPEAKAETEVETKAETMAEPAESVPDITEPMDPVSQMFSDELGPAAPATNGSVPEPVAPAEKAPEPSKDVAAAPTNGVNVDDDVGLEDVELVPLAEGEHPLLHMSLEQALQDSALWLFGTSLKDYVDNVTSESPDVRQAGQAAQEIVDVFAQSEASVREVARVLAAGLDGAAEMEDVETNRELLAAGEAEEDLEHDVLFYILRTSAGYVGDDKAPSYTRVLRLLVLLTEARVDVGFRWLLLQAGPHYSAYVQQYAQGSVQAALVRDLRQLQEQAPGLFYNELPRIYAALPGEFAGCRGIARSVVSLIDQPQVYRLSILCARGQLRLFGQYSAAIARVVDATLDCDAFEQVCLWQLLNAELAASPLLACALTRHLLVQGSLDPAANSEAANGLLALLRTVPPSGEMLLILAEYLSAASSLSADERETRSDFVGSALTAWARSCRQLLLSLLPGLKARAESAAELLVAQWTDRFLQRSSILDAAEVRQALNQVDRPESPQKPVAEEKSVTEEKPVDTPPKTASSPSSSSSSSSPSSSSPEDGSSSESEPRRPLTRSQRSSSSRSTSSRRNGRKRQNPSPVRQSPRLRRRKTAKRRRRAADSSDESSEPRARNGRRLQSARAVDNELDYSSSPIVSSSSLSGDSD
ncbi:hypothetical protein GGF46_004685 [Coemansia sp. RSA 552]|nr:hypothetical protein GGF46_004685 [Coemansia sp. RSA 552]